VIALVTYPYAPSVDVPDAFLLEIMSGLGAGLHAGGYDLLMIQIAVGDTSWIARYLDSGRVDGFVLLSSSCTDEHLQALETRGAPCVVWGRKSEGRGFSTVTGDSLAGGRMATEHLLCSGRRRIAFIGGPYHEDEVRDRLSGYAAALAEHGIDFDESLVAYGDYTPESGAARMGELLERAGDLDAVFVCSDLMAITAIDELRARGRGVPGDVSVVGYDDIAIAAHSDPPLTTIRQPGPLVGRLLAQSAISRVTTAAVTHASIPAELVVRISA
jgi:DNA-binding LacI/PurR family transcriptional regulator